MEIAMPQCSSLSWIGMDRWLNIVFFLQCMSNSPAGIVCQWSWSIQTQYSTWSGKLYSLCIWQYCLMDASIEIYWSLVETREECTSCGVTQKIWQQSSLFWCKNLWAEGAYYMWTRSVPTCYSLGKLWIGSQQLHHFTLLSFHRFTLFFLHVGYNWWTTTKRLRPPN